MTIPSPASALRILAAALALTVAAVPAPARAGGDWNETGIAWKTPEQGLAEAKASNKPVCLVLYTDWCPHCTNYAKVFHDPAVVEASKALVMIHVNKDKDAATSAKYAPDGDYIPRTLFLKPDGALMPEVTEQREQYKYFYDESDPTAVLRSMKLVAGMKFGG
jgi:protein-disulfide reductase (glutathione)